MVKKKAEDYMEEADRVAERLFNEEGKNITDKQSFNRSFGRMTETTSPTEKQKKFIQLVFDNYTQRHPVTPKGDIGKEALRRAERVKKEHIPRNLDTPAKVKGKIVFAERTSIRRNNKVFNVFRDRKGRFASRR